MSHLATHLPTRRPTVRTSVAALLGATLLAATAAHAIPVQYTAKVGLAGTFLDSPTGTPQVFPVGRTPSAIGTFTVTVETDQAVAAPNIVGPDLTNFTVDPQFLPLLSAKLNIGGTDHPLDATQLRLFTARTTYDGGRILLLGAANPALPTGTPLYPASVTEEGFNNLVTAQNFIWVFQSGVPSPTPPVPLPADPAPLTVAGSYIPVAQLSPPPEMGHQPLPFTDGASLAAAVGYYTNSGTPPLFSWEVKLLPTTKPFSFYAPVATKSAKEPEVVMAAGFSLAGNTNGIDPATEVVKLSVGSYSVTVPVGGFKKGKLPVWTYTTTKVAGVQRKIVLTQAGANAWVMAATLDDTAAGLAGIVKGAAADVTLTIGDDTGTKNIIVR